MFEVKRTPLFYTRGSGHYQQSPRIKKLNYTSVVEQAVHFWRKRPPLSEAVENFDNDGPGEVNTTHSGWTNLMSNFPRLPQE